MKSACLAGCVTGLLMMLGGCSGTPAPPPDTSAADLKAINSMDSAWPGYWESKDLDKIVNFYADDASVLVPDMPIMTGRDAIRAGLGKMIEDRNLAMSSATVKAVVAKGGDLAYTQGTYTMTRTNPKTKKPETETGKYLTVFKKQADGTWKAVEDINNADAPAKPVLATRAKKRAPATKKKRRKKA